MYQQSVRSEIYYARAARQDECGHSTGQQRVLVAEAFLPMRKSVEILGADMKPAVVRSLITESLNCMLLKSDWHLRKEAADTIAALAASSQVPE